MRDAQRAELGRFLRARRLALRPEEAGITPHQGRRRTPGLRREEVAERAAISVSWYTWLEQGRDIHVSDAVLDSIAESLQLDTPQRTYLYSLARGQGRGRAHPGDAGCLPASIHHILASHEPSPGYVIDRRFDIIGWNKAALAAFGDFSVLPMDERNVLHLLFSDFLRSHLLNWEANARFALGAFRASTWAYVEEPWFKKLVAELSHRNENFRCWWSEYNVELRPVADKEIDHPMVGRMVLEETALLLDDGSGRRLILYTPKPGTGTDAKLSKLRR
ncbi:MAG: helix-turn-helix transcriptional regulator [Actinomycetota bacterium]|nr:helix-turn-helix transcriptional regulator [Actinomycetota bacterium]